MFVEKSDPLYKHALFLMHKAWGTEKTPHVFPGPQPISIERKHMPLLKNNDYVVCEKTDGVRNMVLIFTFNGKKVSLMINRALEITEIKLKFPKTSFDGTLLDGELYEDKFMIYDIVVDKGKHVGHLNFLERLERMEKVIKSTISMKSDAIKLKLKKFHLMQDFKYFMKEYLPNVEQKVDGLVFTPINEPVKIGTHETLFKWKERDHNTIDFFVRYEYNDWRLHVQEKGKLIFESVLPHEKVPAWMEDSTIVECQYMVDNIPMYWQPIKERKDKKHPNNRRTFYRTLVNIKEDIKIEEFLSYT